MITREETEFSAEVYAQLNEHLGSAAIELTVQQRNLSFGLHSVYTNRGTLWDASQADDTLYRVYIADGILYLTTLANEDSGNQAWSEPIVIDTDVDDIPPSIYQNLAIFYSKDGDISRAHYAVDTWSVTNTWAVVPDGILHFIAGGGVNLLHMAVWRTDWNTEFFTVTTEGVTESGILIPHQLTGFAAINGPTDEEFDTDSNIIAMSLDLPVQIGTRATGAQVDTIAYRSNGILSFMYQRGTWSDHFFVERFDDASNWQYRKHVKLSALPNGHYALVTYGKDGYSGDPHESLHYFFTSNGKYWELPWLFKTTDITHGGKLLVNGKFAYMVTTGITSRSYATELVSDAIPDEITLDITNRVSGYESSMAEGRQTALLVRDEDNWYASSMLVTPGVYSLITKWGIGSNLQQVAHEIIEVCSPTKDTPVRELTIKARDLMSLLNTHVRAANPRIHDTQVVGADEYNDVTNTTYGGLQHTAGILGSWSTEDGWLLARNNNNRSLAFKTFKIDFWNGSIQAKVNPELMMPDEDDQYIGLVWRGYDKDNYYSFEYEVPTRQLRLNEVRAGEKTQLASPITGIDWVRISRYMRVRYRYSHVICEWSTDGTTWTMAFDEILPGKEPVETGDQPVPIEEGQVGLTARGYTTGDMYVTDPWDSENVPATNPSIPDEDRDYEGGPDPDPGGEEEPAEPESGMTDATGSVFAFLPDANLTSRLSYEAEFVNYKTTTNFDGDPPTWASKTMPGLYDSALSWLHESYLWYNYPLSACVDPFSPAFVGEGTQVDAWVLTHPPVTEDGAGRTYFDNYGRVKIYKVTDIFGTPTSSLKYIVPNHNYNSSYLVAGKIVASKLVKDHVVAALIPDTSVSGNRNTIVVSTVNGDTWLRYAFPSYATTPPASTNFFPALNLEISAIIPGRVWVTANEVGSNPVTCGKVFRSDSYGESFSKVLEYPVFDLHIPEDNINEGSEIGEIAYCSIQTGPYTARLARLDGSGLTYISPATFIEAACTPTTNAYWYWGINCQWHHTFGSIVSYPGNHNIIAAAVRYLDGATYRWTLAISTNGGTAWTVPAWNVTYDIDKLEFSSNNSQVLFGALGTGSTSFHRTADRGAVFEDWDNKNISPYGGWGPGSE